ncbi:MAG: hypothetical protein F6K35_41995 [Okeania sp. SIO2H7]|nr:hypothetical protein [Okeania sp. SIO2H7]
MVYLTSETQKSVSRQRLDSKSINAQILEWENSMYEENKRKYQDEALVEKQLEELPELLASLESFSEK